MDILTFIQEIKIGDMVILTLAAIKLWDIALRLINGITCQHDEKQEMETLKKTVCLHDEQIKEMRKEHAKDREYLVDKFDEFAEKQRKYQEVSLLSKIFGYWKAAKEQGYVTPYDLQMFSKCIKEFESKKSGDGAMTLEVEKYRDEVYALPVKE